MNTRPRANTVVLSSCALALALSTGCCHFQHARDFRMTALSFVPPRSALELPPCTPFYVNPAFYGHYGTCWRPWPEGWIECPCAFAESEIEKAEPLPEQPALGEGLPPVPPMEPGPPPAAAPEDNSSLLPRYDRLNGYGYNPPRVYVLELAEHDRAVEPTAYNSVSQQSH